MIGFAVICTILGGILGSFLEPIAFSVSIPIAIMGGFILYELGEKRKKRRKSPILNEAEGFANAENCWTGGSLHLFE